MERIKELISRQLSVPASGINLTKVSGGSINNCYRVSAGSATYFCKQNSSASFPGLFAAEVKGLQTLKSTRAIQVPAIISLIEEPDVQLLLLEFVQEGPRTSSFWKVFGERLALLHSVHADSCGFGEDNYMGALKQYNDPMNDWGTFFVKRRLMPQITIAADKGYLTHHDFDRLIAGVNSLFPDEPFSLLHGDLWSGNFLCNANGQPILIDPAVYYGNRNMDLGMTTLFGGFDPVFYEAYQYHLGFSPDHKRLWQVCNLYPLLIHLNLFGSSYLPPILAVLRSF